MHKSCGPKGVYYIPVLKLVSYRLEYSMRKNKGLGVRFQSLMKNITDTRENVTVGISEQTR